MKKLEHILQVKNLHVYKKTASTYTSLVQNINLNLKRGEVLGLIGESGSGKTVTSTAILQLFQQKNVHVDGSILLNGKELNGLDEKEMRTVRGKEIAFIMQNPMNAFTPVFTIGHQFVETIRSHTKWNKKQAREMAVEAMKAVNLPDPASILKQYPFQLSGGMLQRVMIAFAACLNPAVIIADEPTTALDVYNQKKVLLHLNNIRADYGSAILLISHDLGVIAEMADQVAVMRKGEIVEQAEVFELFDYPKHEYTKKLLQSRPTLNID
ncbi:nickel import ATP-binding protein NikD [Priestia flexa]|nr:nickel import ATP-binding protein NikD [Priestia flexa]